MVALVLDFELRYSRLFSENFSTNVLTIHLKVAVHSFKIEIKWSQEPPTVKAIKIMKIELNNACVDRFPHPTLHFWLRKSSHFSKIGESFLEEILVISKILLDFLEDQKHLKLNFPLFFVVSIINEIIWSSGDLYFAFCSCINSEIFYYAAAAVSLKLLIFVQLKSELLMLRSSTGYFSASSQFNDISLLRGWRDTQYFSQI